ncbi:hypothetical protein DCAR_0104889 [Daucus carota subsp. sativus]|uniref:PABS domain-containing protein n=1 Tax=Daucus carota subsp. sativus TaxID=79200 RepID=A0AAF0WCE5_DAUCS|nr:PREDICTED: uncharacterized protein LOC108207648 [Daucus carota subsp. sativus]WOG85698.1 hypothetical protein DCAR_0104889 [Daucus carota subsp. sativus]
MILVNPLNFITFYHSSGSVSSCATHKNTPFKFLHSQGTHQRNHIGGQPLKGSHYNLKKRDPFKLFQSLSSSRVESNKEEEEAELQLVASFKSRFNDIMIVDTAESRLLLLDTTYNIHSIFNKGEKWTGCYWDEFASLPAVVPNGPIAIFGLAGGTAAHLMLDLWPSLQLEGWEIDEILIDKARVYLGLSDLEKHTKDGGIVHVHVGDAFAASIPGGYAGIVVDLFSNGKVLPEMHECGTWLEMKDKLMPNGRIMVNCGGSDVGAPVSDESSWEQNSTIKALCQAFPGEVSWKKLVNEGENYLALTGPLPDLNTWSTDLPDQLSSNVMQWKSCCPS